MALVLPNTLAADDDIDAEPLQANFTAIEKKFDGGITDADISALAAISGDKTAQNSMTGDRIRTGTIAQLQMAASSVGTPQLIALAVDKTKLSTTAGSKITKTQAEVYTANITISVALGGGNQAVAINNPVLTTAVVTSITSWAISLSFLACNSAHIASPGLTAAQLSIKSGTASPAVAIPSATTTVLSITQRAVTSNSGSYDTSFDLCYILNS